LAALAASRSMTPNQVTVLSGATSAVAIVCIATLTPTWWVACGASVLLLLGYALDSADGQLARLYRSGNPAGEWLDHVVDAARLPALHLAIAWSLLHRTSPADVGAIIAGCFALVSSVWFFGQILAGQLLPREPSAAARSGTMSSFVKLPNDVGILYLATSLLAWTVVFVPVYAALFAIAVATMVVSLRRKWAMLSAIPSSRR
jgi:phosphatidylglycerophosphate synthase